MKISYKIARVANKLLLALTVLLALVLFVYSLYVLYDVLYTEKNAFVSYDMLQYKPAAAEAEETDPESGFHDLLELNGDAVGWITIYDTNIDYPIVQGRNDLEYSAKDIYGNSSLTGSIYLSCENRKNFHDWYNLVYGHHMENGAMFGGIDYYRNEDYFRSHQKGMLRTPDGNYQLTVFACVVTDSYDGTVYTVADKDISQYPELMRFIRENSVSYDTACQKDTADESVKLVALSTCEDASTNGRIVLFADLIPGEEPEAVPAEAKVTLLEAVGHLSDERHWAFLNLVCVLLSFGILLPVSAVRKKYRQYGYAKDKAEETEKILDAYEQAKTAAKAESEPAENANADPLTVPYSEEEIGRFRKICKGLRRFLRLIRIGVIAEILLFLISLIVFLLTENITRPMVIRDRWTGWMILLTALSLLADFICFRYRGERPDEDADQQQPQPETENPFAAA